MGDKVLMPKELTAENGAKGLLSGEFYTEHTVECYACEGGGEEYREGVKYDCADCGGSGELLQKQTVDWTTIKDIYAMAVKHLAGKG